MKTIILIMIFSINVFSETQIPLLPSKPIARKNLQTLLGNNYISERRNLLGFELGALGQKIDANGDALGFKLLGGIRAIGIFPIGNKFFLKPFLGIFVRPENVAKVSVTRIMGEVGINPQYMIIKKSNFTWIIGLTQKLEVNTSNIKMETLSASSQNSSISDLSGTMFRYRLGPTIGFTSAINREFGLIFDYELTFSVTKPIYTYTGLSLGLLFRL